MDEIERLKQQHKEELDLAQEVIVNLRRDLAHAHKRIESQDAVWNNAIDAAISEARSVSALRYEDAYTANKIIDRLLTNKRKMA